MGGSAKESTDHLHITTSTRRRCKSSWSWLTQNALSPQLNTYKIFRLFQVHTRYLNLYLNARQSGTSRSNLVFFPFGFTNAISFPNSVQMNNYLQFIFCLTEFHSQIFQVLSRTTLQKVIPSCGINFMIKLPERNQKTTFL